MNEKIETVVGHPQFKEIATVVEHPQFTGFWIPMSIFALPNLSILEKIILAEIEYQNGIDVKYLSKFFKISEKRIRKMICNIIYHDYLDADYARHFVS